MSAVSSLPWPRAVVHLDVDAFYASVEQLRRPELRGRPVIVGGAADAGGRIIVSRGVVSAASYEARCFGVHSAMPLTTALRLCPQAIVVPVDVTAYRRVSAHVVAVAREVTPLVEPVSLDEAYLDVTASVRRFGPPEAIAARVRDRIAERTGLSVSVGVATSKVVAKVASDLRKPHGFVVVLPGEEAAFLASLPVRRLPGVGEVAERNLAALGVRTVGELAALPCDVVRRRLGRRLGETLWRRAHGIDPSPVVIPRRPVSMSREETFLADVGDRSTLEQQVRQLAADVGRRLRGGGGWARVVTLKLRYGDFTTVVRRRALPAATDGDRSLARAALCLLDQWWNGRPVRLLGVGVTELGDAVQLDLFGAADEEREERIDRILDTLRARFGEETVRRGVMLAGGRDLDRRGENVQGSGRGDVDAEGGMG